MGTCEKAMCVFVLLEAMCVEAMCFVLVLRMKESEEWRTSWRTRMATCRRLGAEGVLLTRCGPCSMFLQLAMCVFVLLEAMCVEAMCFVLVLKESC